MRFLEIDVVMSLGPRRSMRLIGAKLTSVPGLIDKLEHELSTFRDPSLPNSSFPVYLRLMLD